MFCFVFKKYFILLIFILSVNLLQAQLGKETWNWAFGCTCSLNFNSGNPVILGVDSICVQEGSASISDINTGQLLFFTDGTNAWDKNSHRMPNGYGMIGGQGTSTQAALIVPKPGSSTIYYLFSADQGGYVATNQGVHYSVIDMSLNGGLGDVVSGSKNILLTPPPTTEKLMGIKHCDGINYWVITHPFNTNAFYAYLVTSAGVNPTPVISNIGTVHSNISGDSIETVGYLKASPNGRRLACAVQYMQFVELFDFDNSSGIVSNPIKIVDKPKCFYPYGVSFSPDNSKLFVSADDSLFSYSTSSNLFEYDLSGGTASSIISSKIHIPFNVSGYVSSGALQLASNNKIYCAIEVGSSISVINNPNDTGISCNYQENSIPVFPYGGPNFGLPNFIDANIITPVSNIVNTSLCSFNSYTISVNNYSNYQWQNGDTTQSLTINNFGTYWVSYITPQNCKEIDTFHITKVYPPVVNILHDTSVCSNTTITLIINATDTNVTSYLWNDGFSSPIHSISSLGTYWVNYTFNDFCVSRDSFNYFVDSIPAINLGRDTGICISSFTLLANSNENYLWNTGAVSQQITVSNSGNYWVMVTSPQGCKNSDTVYVTFYTPPLINILHDTTECGNSFIPITINATYSNTIAYLWNNGFTLPVQTLNSPGYYSVDYFFNHGCVSKDSFNLTLYPYPIIDLGVDTSFCLGTLSLNAFFNSSCTYLWNTGQTTSNITASEPGIYWVKVNNNSCLYNDTLIINPKYSLFDFSMPNIVTPNNDGINDFIDFSKFQLSSLQLSVYNRWGIKIFENNNPNCLWKPTEDDGTYYYVAQYIINCGAKTQNKTLKGFITVTR